jgi:hypothetical protein
MKLATAIVLGVTLLGSAAASAQGVELRVGPSSPDRVYVDRDRDWRDGRAQYRDRDDVVVIKKKRKFEREGYYDEPRRRTTIIER